MRANEAGLPANDAIATIPRPVLVTTGASFLTPAVLLALAAVGVMYLVYVFPRLRARRKARDTEQSAARARFDAQQARLDASAEQSKAESIAEIAATVERAAAAGYTDSNRLEEVRADADRAAARAAMRRWPR